MIHLSAMTHVDVIATCVTRTANSTAYGRPLFGGRNAAHVFMACTNRLFVTDSSSID